MCGARSMMLMRSRFARFCCTRSLMLMRRCCPGLFSARAFWRPWRSRASILGWELMMRTTLWKNQRSRTPSSCSCLRAESMDSSFIVRVSMSVLSSGHTNFSSLTIKVTSSLASARDFCSSFAGSSIAVIACWNRETFCATSIERPSCSGESIDSSSAGRSGRTCAIPSTVRCTCSVAFQYASMLSLIDLIHSGIFPMRTRSGLAAMASSSFF
mmetsp:Transcript_23737/g.77177  ORF Transcript_23737/g.77177 Transcript_23737/m.77177 type:complete len:213 (-) Transcript_23737:6103-6741(-)